MDVIIYHNPDCGTSRNTLAMIRNAGVEPHVIEYLKTPPTLAELKRLHKLLGVPVREMIRSNETEYAELGLAAAELAVDLHVGHDVLDIVDDRDALFVEAFPADDAEGQADVLAGLLATLGRDDNVLHRRGLGFRGGLGRGGQGRRQRQDGARCAEKKTIHVSIHGGDADERPSRTGRKFRGGWHDATVALALVADMSGRRLFRVAERRVRKRGGRPVSPVRNLEKTPVRQR